MLKMKISSSEHIILQKKKKKKKKIYKKCENIVVCSMNVASRSSSGSSVIQSVEKKGCPKEED